MGSRNSDGTRISQSRQSTRNVGPALTFSAERLEVDIVLSNSGLASSTLETQSLAQQSVIGRGWDTQVSNSLTNTLIERVGQGSGFVVSVPSNPDPYAVSSLSGPLVGDLTIPSGFKITFPYERRAMVGGGTVTLLSSSPRYQLINGTSARRVNLPASPTNGMLFDIKDADGTASAGPITVHGNGVNIDGAASGIISAGYESRTVLFNGTDWNFV